MPLMPELVYQGDIHQLNYTEIIPVLVNAVKELHGEIETQVKAHGDLADELERQVKDLTALVAKQKQDILSITTEFGFEISLGRRGAITRSLSSHTAGRTASNAAASSRTRSG